MSAPFQQERQIVARYTRLTQSCNHPRNFIAITSLVLEICSGQNASMKTKGNNSKIRQARVKVHVQCIPLYEIYPPTKFHNHSLYSLGDMHQTIFKYEKKKKKLGNYSKIKQARVTVHVHCTPPLRSIHPQNFITIGSIVLMISSGQNSSRTINKVQ